jgi:hypothetical protein
MWIGPLLLPGELLDVLVVALYLNRKHKHRFDGAAGFRRLDLGRPSVGGEFRDSIDRKIGQAWEHRAEVGAER